MLWDKKSNKGVFMKKTIRKIIFVLIVVFFASAITGCVILEMAAMIAELGVTAVAGAVEIGGVIEDSASASASVQKTEKDREKEWQKMKPEEQEWFEKMKQYQGIDTF